MDRSRNDTLQTPGPLMKHCVARNRNAAPVRCKGWFASGAKNSPKNKRPQLLDPAAWTHLLRAGSGLREPRGSSA
jgi:hypothetical protein